MFGKGVRRRLETGGWENETGRLARKLLAVFL
jgi:hypothetical protein